MQVLSRGFLLYLLHPIWPDPPFHIRLGRSKACNVAKNNLSEVKHKTMLASGLRSTRMWGDLKAFSALLWWSSHFACVVFACACVKAFLLAALPSLWMGVGKYLKHFH